MTAKLCRQIDDGSCLPLAAQTVSRGATGEFLDILPSGLDRDPVRLLTYKVELFNNSGKSAGNPVLAFSASGTPPPALTGLSAQLIPKGVLLGWQPAARTPAEASESLAFQIKRRTLNPSAKAAAGNPQPKSSREPDFETLEVKAADHVDPGHALDASIQWNQQYRYTMQRVERVELSGHAISILGEAGDPVTITARDVFPPAVPQDLTAGTDTAHHAVDLSWTPDTEKDLAGYYVYRRDTGTSLAATRVSPLGNPITEPSFRDSAAEPGHTYAYSVSAIDNNGNESPRSREIMERLPDHFDPQ